MEKQIAPPVENRANVNLQPGRKTLKGRESSALSTG